MLAYVTLGSNNNERALAFYDSLLEELGAKRVFKNDRIQYYSTGLGSPMIGVGTPADLQPATPSNGGMTALTAPDRETVDRVYNHAIELGATCEGPPGERLPIFYGAYFRDLDGNKLCICRLGPA